MYMSHSVIPLCNHFKIEFIEKDTEMSHLLVFSPGSLQKLEMVESG